MSAHVRLPVRMTIEEFMDWDPGDGLAWQLVDGEPRAMAPAKVGHGAIQARIIQLLGAHLDAAGGRCRVIVAPGITPRVDARHNVRMPDLAVTCAPPEGDEALLLEPLLVIEILSPSNQAETWSNVWTYTSIPSVREILILKTVRIEAEVLRRLPDGTWPAETSKVTAGELALASIDFRGDLQAFYRTSLLGSRPAG